MNISDFVKLSKMLRDIITSTVPCHRVQEMAVDETDFQQFPDVSFEPKKQETMFVMMVKKLEDPLIITIVVLVATQLISFAIFGYAIHTLKKEKRSIDVELFGMKEIQSTTENNELSPNGPHPNEPLPNEPLLNEPSLKEPSPNEPSLKEPNESSPSSASGEKN